MGSTVLLELDGKKYVPIHDLTRNISTLIDFNQNIIESTRYSSFGQQQSTVSESINPWGFQSKRFDSETGFIYMTSSVFLKSQERIVALAMVMCLCLLVYTIAQRYLRKQIEQRDSSVPNQLGKSTRTPTMRWVFQLFEGVHLLIHRAKSKTEELILNMNPIRDHILALLGPPFQKIYSNS